jgi:hypothetical protein
MYELYLTIAGHHYGVRFDDGGLIRQTYCESRWGWTNYWRESMDEWLTTMLQDAVDEYLNTDPAGVVPSFGADSGWFVS